MIKFDISQVMATLDSLTAKQKAGLTLFGDTLGKKMANEAKKNKPWENRTSHAMQSIDSYTAWEKNTLIIGVTGGMDYSPFLEFAHEKKYAVLYPTILDNKEAFIKGAKLITG